MDVKPHSHWIMNPLHSSIHDPLKDDWLQQILEKLLQCEGNYNAATLRTSKKGCSCCVPAPSPHSTCQQRVPKIILPCTLKITPHPEPYILARLSDFIWMQLHYINDDHTGIILRPQVSHLPLIVFMSLSGCAEFCTISFSLAVEEETPTAAWDCR